MGCVSCLWNPSEHLEERFWHAPVAAPLVSGRCTPGSFRDTSAARLPLSTLCPLLGTSLQVSACPARHRHSDNRPNCLLQTISSSLALIWLLLSSRRFLCSCLPWYQALLFLLSQCWELSLTVLCWWLFFHPHLTCCFCDGGGKGWNLLFSCSRFAWISPPLWSHLPRICCTHLIFMSSLYPLPGYLTASSGCPVGTLTSSCPKQMIFSLKPVLFHVFPY